MKKQKKTVAIYNWMMQSQFGHQFLYGYVKKHYRKELSNAFIRSSTIVRFDLAKGECETLNTVYKLKSPWSLANDRKYRSENFAGTNARA